MRLRAAAGRSAVPAALFAAALVASPATAAQWSEPAPLGARAGPGSIVAAAHDAGGRGLLVWGVPPATYRTAVRPAAGGWTAGPLLPPRLGLLHGRVAVELYGRSRALLVGPRRTGSGPSLQYRMVAALGRSDATFGPLQTLEAGAITGRRAARSLSTPSVSVTRAGDAIAAWSLADGTTSVIRVVERPAGRPFGRVRRISGLGARMPAAATSVRGDRVVAWYRDGWVEARVRRRGERWGPVRRIARSRHTPAALRAAVDARARVLLAWAATEWREGRPLPFAFDAAVGTPDGRWAHRPLERYSARGFPFSGAQGRIWPLFDSSGRMFVAWHGEEDGRPAVEVAQLDETGRVEATEVLTGPGEPARPTDAVAGPDGRVAIVWERETGETVRPSEVRASVRTDDAGFGDGETVPVRCEVAFLCVPGAARAAFDPVTGDLTVAWLQREDTAYRVWAATRAAP